MNIEEDKITIDKKTLDEYKIAEQQSEDLSKIWAEIAEEIDIKKHPEEKAIYRGFSEIYDYLAGNYNELIETIKWYNEYLEKEEKERKYVWKNREIPEK